jgi:hypothetical protein
MGPDKKGQVTPRSARSLTLALGYVGAGRPVSVSGRRSAMTEWTRWPLGLVVPTIVTPRQQGERECREQDPANRNLLDHVAEDYQETEEVRCEKQGKLTLIWLPAG